MSRTLAKQALRIQKVLEDANVNLRARFNRLATRRGVKKAVVAVAASILTSAYFILRDGVPTGTWGPTIWIGGTRDHRAPPCQTHRGPWLFS
jgi:hypothetical protein